MCAHAVSVAIRKVEGVESVKVSLNEGVADIRLKPGNTVDPEKIRQIVVDNGFTPRGAEVRLKGSLVERDRTFAVQVTGIGRVYRLDPPPTPDELARLREIGTGQLVTMTGFVPEPGKGKEPVLRMQTVTSDVPERKPETDPSHSPESTPEEAGAEP